MTPRWRCVRRTKEARDRPHKPSTGLQVPGTRQPPQFGSRRQLAPADRQVSVEDKQARQLPRRGGLLQVALVVRSGPVTVAGADTPVHAPAPVRSPSAVPNRFSSGGQRSKLSGLIVTSITASGSASADYPFLCGFAGHTSPARSAATCAVIMTSARSIGRRSACFMHSRSRREVARICRRPVNCRDALAPETHRIVEGVREDVLSCCGGRVSVSQTGSSVVVGRGRCLRIGLPVGEGHDVPQVRNLVC